MSLKKHLSYIHLERIDSTQTYAKQHLKNHEMDCLYCVYADNQTQGKGSQGKSWHSPEGNLYATFSFIEDVAFSSSSMQLAHLLSLSVASVLTSMGLTPTLKWPNDVMLSHKKVSGILCECITQDPICQVIAGVGVNLNMKKEEFISINQPATSIQLEQGTPCSRNTFLFSLGEVFLENLNIYLEKGFAPFLSQYEALMIYKKAPIHLMGEFLGIVDHVDTDGSLIITDLKGSQVKTYSGSLDISKWTKT